MHPILTPGTHLLRRDAHHLQLGLDPRTALAVPDDPAVRAALTALHRGALSPQRDSPSGAVVAPLVGSGHALADDAALRSALPPVQADTPWARHSLSALARREPHRLDAALASRGRHAVRVTPYGGPASDLLAADLADLCGRTALTLSPRPRRHAARGAAPLQEVAVAVGVGEPPRDLLDPWVRAATPHLVLRVVEGEVLVGPFVLPGQSACLRCVDAHLSDTDPAWPLLVEQHARAARSDRPDGIPEPADAAVVTVGLGLAARELATFAEGGRPSLVGTVIRVPDRATDRPDLHRWERHSRCGCSWD